MLTVSASSSHSARGPMNRTTMPTEDAQYELYRAVVEAVAPRPVTLRTFDIGGDKFASSFQLPAEMNPAPA